MPYCAADGHRLECPPMRRTLLLAVVLLAAGPTAAAHATVRYAAPGATGSYPCAESDPCSLDYAIAVPGDGDDDEAVLAPGDYVRTTPLLLRRRTISGPAPGTGEARLVFDLDHPAPALQVEVNDAVVRNLTIETSGALTGLLEQFGYSGITVDGVRVFVRGPAAAALQVHAGALVRDSEAWSRSDVAVLLLSTSGSTAPVDFVNATLYGATRALDLNELPGAGTTTLHVRLTNVIARAGRPDLPDLDIGPDNASVTSVLETSYSNLGPISSAPYLTRVAGPGLQSADPLLTDLAAPDFHELAGSLTIDAGTTAVPGGLVGPDLDGDARSGPPDIGADEYIAPPPPPPPAGDGGDTGGTGGSAGSGGGGTAGAGGGGATAAPPAPAAVAPPPTPAPSTTAPAPVTDVAAPRIGRLRLRSRHVACRGRAVLRVRVDEPAALRVVTKRRRGGRSGRVRGCRRHARVVQHRTMGSATTLTIRLPRGLRPGRWVATVTASDAAGNRSKPRRITFRVQRHSSKRAHRRR
jgi:hypothetical protein